MADILHVNPKSSWKKVKISTNLFHADDLDGLISLEELTDYDIVPGNKQNVSENAGKVYTFCLCRSIFIRQLPKFVHFRFFEIHKSLVYLG